MRKNRDEKKYTGTYIRFKQVILKVFLRLDIQPVQLIFPTSITVKKFTSPPRQRYRGFIPKPGGTLGYPDIIVLLNRRGLKRPRPGRSGTFGSISDLNVGSVQLSRWLKYCLLARHYTNLKTLHTNRFCKVTPHHEQ